LPQHGRESEDQTQTKSMRQLRYFLILLLVSCLPSLAQLANTTKLLGNVTDKSGAPVAGASVSAVNTASRDTYKATTTNDGLYTFEFLRVGIYNITAQKDGFEALTRQNVVVDANQTVRADLVLEVGIVSQHIEVQATNPPISTDDAAVKEIISQKAIADLPLNGRDPLQLAITTPGVILGPKSSSTGIPPGEDFIGAGSREIQNSISLDGASIVNNLITVASFHPSVDSIQEFEVQTGTYSAQYGAYLGAHLNLVTKSGSNDLHGAVYEFLRNDALDATPFFSKKVPLRQNQFGVEVGGPIIIPKLYDGRNKTFFMFDYEGLREIRSSSSLATTFTDKMRSGDFSELSTQLFYPNTKTPIPGNQLQSLLSPQALALLQWFPKANAPGITDNLIATYPNNDHWNQEIGRLDQNIGDKIRLFVRFAWLGENIFGGAANPFQATTIPDDVHNWVAGYTQTITPNIVNDFRVAKNYLNTDALNYWYVNGPKNAGTALGIPGFTADTLNSSPGIPAISINNYVGTGSAGTNWFQDDTTWQGADQFTWNHGDHTLIAGADVRKMITSRIAVNDTLGLFNFDGHATGNAAADFLTGYSSGVTTPAPEVRNTVAEWRDGFFVTDNWHATKNLTLDLGVRYELPTVPYTVNGYATILNSTFTGLIPSNTPQPGFKLTGPNHKDFAPRVGLAYRIDDKTVFRAGYGIYYNPNQTNSFTFLSSNPPFAFSASYPSSSDPTFADPEPAGAGSTPSKTPNVISPAAHMPSAAMNQWSAGLQRGLWSGSALDISYLGSHTVHLDHSFYINTPQPGPGSVQLRRPYQDFGDIRIIQNDENSSYQGLTAAFRQRLSHGVTALVNYTWSHDLDASTDSNGGGYPQNPFNWQGDYGNSNWDIRHRFVASFTYDLPFFRSAQSAIVKTLLAGWQTNGIFVAQTGTPVNITAANDYTNTGRSNERPNLVGPVSDTCTNGQLVNCIGLSSFALPSNFQWGDFGRNVLRGPGYFNLDFSAFKDFAIKENIKLQYRAEFFNLTNTPEFANPSGTLPGLSSGVFSFTGVNPGSFGDITSTIHDNREIQMALKLVF
jgi:outer membrane receptor protein involved in Fe transport